jgi:hypothetical protein
LAQQQKKYFGFNKQALEDGGMQIGLLPKIICLPYKTIISIKRWLTSLRDIE